MDREILKDVLLSQRKVKEIEVVPRILFKKVKEYANTPFVIIISGIRRCGKSTLLNELRTKDTYYAAIPILI